MNDTIHSIKYVFEARIDSVQTFAGDDAGNKVPYGRADWNMGIGNFDDRNGTQLMAYSKVWITVGDVYKGKVPKKMVVLLPQPFTTVTALKAPNGDTVLSYMEVQPSHGNYESALLPSKSYPISRLYWCYDLSKKKGSKEYQLKTFIHTPLKSVGYIPQADGSGKQGIVYAMIGEKIFENKELFENYLHGIRGLKFK